MIHHHKEEHFRAPETVRDVIIGMSDGLTVPFAIAAGLSGAHLGTNVIVLGGLAEMVAGSISMGLGGYLAAKSDIDHYNVELAREYLEIKEKTEVEKQEVRDVLEAYGLNKQESEGVIKGLSKRPDAWVDFMMKFELGLEKPDAKRALISAVTIGGAYIAGGIIPLSPYILISNVPRALMYSVVVTAIALLIFGGLKGHFVGMPILKSATQTLIVGGVAAGAAFWLARFF